MKKVISHFHYSIIPVFQNSDVKKARTKKENRKEEGT